MDYLAELEKNITGMFQKSYNTDEYVCEIAENDVCMITDIEGNEIHGYVIAHLSPQESHEEYIPFDADDSIVFDLDNLDVERVLVQNVFFKKNKGVVSVDSNFHVVSKENFVLLYSFNSESLIVNVQNTLESMGFTKKVKITKSQNTIMQYELGTKEISLCPIAMYTHISRTFLLSHVSTEIAMQVVCAHEMGHVNDEELNNNTLNLTFLIDDINRRKKMMHKEELTLKELRTLKLDVSTYVGLLDKYERNAWNIGKKFLPENVMPYYDWHSNSVLSQLDDQPLFTQDIDFYIDNKIYRKRKYS